MTISNDGAIRIKSAHQRLGCLKLWTFIPTLQETCECGCVILPTAGLSLLQCVWLWKNNIWDNLRCCSAAQQQNTLKKINRVGGHIDTTVERFSAICSTVLLQTGRYKYSDKHWGGYHHRLMIHIWTSMTLEMYNYISDEVVSWYEKWQQKQESKLLFWI